MKQHRVKTEKPGSAEQRNREMRMPHERDESDDSQSSAPRSDIKQAYKDLEEGQVNTDLRGVQGVDQVTSPPDDTPADRARKQTPRAK